MWYAAGHRVRGDGLPKKSGGEEQQVVFLFHPRPGFWPKPEDEGMTHLKPLFCVAPPLEVGSGMLDVVVVSDSAMDLPGVMYGLACLLRENNLNLLWLVSRPGAGAKELAAVWNRAPRCALGLTCYNLKDATRLNPWGLTEEILMDIQVLLIYAKEKCAETHEVFVHNAGSFPDLRPKLYPRLVCRVSDFIRERGCRVRDGADFVNHVDRRDLMHFSIESTPTLVEMYGNAIFQMQETSASDSESTSATPELRRAASVSPERQHPPASAPADADGERSRDLASRNEEQLVPRHNRGPGEAEDCISDDEEQVSSTETPEQRSEVVAPRPRRRDPSDIQVLREFVEKVNQCLSRRRQTP